MGITILPIKFNSQYFNELIQLELLLWPDNDYDGLYNETKESSDYYFGAIHDNQLIGFIQLAIREEHVNGSSTSPVGYIEGIYVIEDYRKKGIARKLMEWGYRFLKENDCSEIGSDVELDNIMSQVFHEKMGFTEVERVVFYIRKLD